MNIEIKIKSILYGMRQRCYNKNFTHYSYYGGRGIAICSKWRNDSASFVKWALLNGYKEGLSIDRINNDGNYEPSNCRWTTRTVQGRNTKKIYSQNTSGFRGASWHKASNRWRAQIRLGRKKKHLGLFKCRRAAAYAYDEFISINKLEHTKNF